MTDYSNTGKGQVNIPPKPAQGNANTGSTLKDPKAAPMPPPKRA